MNTAFEMVCNEAEYISIAVKHWCDINGPQVCRRTLGEFEGGPLEEFEGGQNLCHPLATRCLDQICFSMSAWFLTLDFQLP